MTVKSYEALLAQHGENPRQVGGGKFWHADVRRKFPGIPSEEHVSLAWGQKHDYYALCEHCGASAFDDYDPRKAVAKLSHSTSCNLRLVLAAEEARGEAQPNER
jgi:hypothetical protein